MTESDVARLARVRAMTRRGRARSIRLRAGLSLSEVAKAARVATTTVFRWESAERSPRGKAALRYLAVLEEIDRPGKGGSHA